jgi:hypothetical protein
MKTSILRKLIRESIESENLVPDRFGDMVPEVDGFFGGMKIPKETFKSKVKNCIMDILMEENQVSEKSFSQLDELKEHLKDVFKENPEFNSIINQMEKNRSRVEFVAETVYSKWPKI